jgi:hypothetical protein
MADEAMMEVIAKLKASKKQSEESSQSHDHVERIKQQQGSAIWNELVEWTELCCASYDPAGELTFGKRGHEFSVAFRKSYYTVSLHVTFDVENCKIAYRVDSDDRFVASSKAKLKGEFSPRVVGECLSFTNGHKNMTAREMGGALLFLLG